MSNLIICLSILHHAGNKGIKMLWGKNERKWKGWQSLEVKPRTPLAWATSTLPLNHIGACKVVWVPGKNLLRRIWCAIVESIFCHYTVRYTYICACICYTLVIMCLCVWSSWYEYTWFKITQAMPGFDWACRHLFWAMTAGQLSCAVHVEDCEWLSSFHGSVAEHWWLKPEVWSSTPGNCHFHFLYFCLITSLLPRTCMRKGVRFCPSVSLSVRLSGEKFLNLQG